MARNQIWNEGRLKLKSRGLTGKHYISSFDYVLLFSSTTRMAIHTRGPVSRW